MAESGEADESGGGDVRAPRKKKSRARTRAAARGVHGEALATKLDSDALQRTEGVSGRARDDTKRRNWAKPLGAKLLFS